MNPQTEQLHVPDGFRLVHRPVSAPRVDERPTMRDRDGNVLAYVDSWSPALWSLN